MSTIHCPISGISFKAEHIPAQIRAPHPIFYLPQKRLLPLYKKYSLGHLSPVDSYLLFLAYLHSTGSITWKVPCSLSPTAADTAKLIANNIHQLISSIMETNSITIPSFKQPSFIISLDNSDLSNVSAYIQAWIDNIETFKSGSRQEIINREISAIEKRLERLIREGINEATGAETLAHWANLCAPFPATQRDKWFKIIRSCYNSQKMFGTRIIDIQVIKDHCLENIMPGSIFLHQLIETLDNGINLHKNFLGFGSYTILDDSSLELKELEIIAEKAPTEEPRREDYPNSVEYLKAKLRYSVVSRRKV